MRYGAGFQILMSAAMLLGPAVGARAQGEDPAGRGVARISVVNGEVSVRRGDSGDWVAAAVNAPLVVQDAIATGEGSRAEIQFDSANMIRLAPNTEVRMAELDNRRYQMQVARGTVMFRVLRPSEAYVEVSTPEVSVRPSKQGAYRVTVLESGQAEIAVRAGEVEVYTPHGVETVPVGSSMLVRDGTSGPEFQTANSPGADEFDRWNEDRDRYLTQSVSYRNVSPSIYGTEDLDNNGRWVNDPSYGQVWVPTVAADWAPYSNGRWAWEDYYGWTWVSYDPWGWAPFHYGRWYHGSVGWCWDPGSRYGTHYWSPALVAFFGFGHGGGGFGFGRIGWVALGPHERFDPWWGRGYHRDGFFNHGVNITNAYRNARIGNGMRAVDANGFGRGGRGFERVTNLREASVMRGGVPMRPSRESLRFADREVRNVPRASANTNFFSHRQPTGAARTPFAQQQSRGVQSAGPRTGRALGQPAQGATNGGWRNSGSVSRPGDAVPRSSPGQNASGSNGNWRRFGEPAQSGQSSPSRGAPNSNPGGSRNFGGDARPGPSSSGYTRGDAVPRSSPGQNASGSNGNWRRFGEPAQSGQYSPSRRAPSTPSGGSGWGHFGEPSAAPRSQAPAQQNWQRNQSSGRDIGSGGNRSQAPSSIRVAPPVVRERSAPAQNAPRGNWNSGGGRSSGGDGGGGRSSGASSGGGFRSNGGGGGGGGHSSGGGGGGGRSGGGGGRSGGRGR